MPLPSVKRTTCHRFPPARNGSLDARTATATGVIRTAAVRNAPDRAAIGRERGRIAPHDVAIEASTARDASEGIKVSSARARNPSKIVRDRIQAAAQRPYRVANRWYGGANSP